MLPTKEEWEATMAKAKSLNCQFPSLTNMGGTQCGSGPFTGVQSDYYWSSSSYAHNAIHVWSVFMRNGNVNPIRKTFTKGVWPVRGGQ